MINVAVDNNFGSWRTAARPLINATVRPETVIWTGQDQISLFNDSTVATKIDNEARVPAEFIKLAKTVACYDSDDKWPLLYRLLFRIVYETRHLLEIESDADVLQANLMAKAVGRDIHKFHAFVRFRRVDCEGEEIYAAWHEPQHFTVERATPFFARRFGSMKFSILTPKGCAHWDKEKLTFSKAVAKTLVPNTDDAESLWLLYYRSIFNPFRLKIKAMKREFPVRHWATLPEAELIPQLIREGYESSSDG